MSYTFKYTSNSSDTQKITILNRKEIALLDNYDKIQKTFLNMKSFIILSLINLISASVFADDHSFETWNNKQFENYPFECVEDGSTPEYTRCYAEKLNKYDWELRKDRRDEVEETYSKWLDYLF